MRYIVWLLGMIGLVPLLMLKKAFETNIVHHEIATKKFIDQSPYRIFFISDIHRRKITNKLITKLSSIDAVIIGGDMAEANVPVNRIADNLKNLAKIAPIYYVWGNNDREVGESTIQGLIEQVNGNILENQAICLRNERHRIMLVGIDDVSSGRADIQHSFVSIKKEDTVVFVSHTPSVFKKVQNAYNPDILLAGHTHGGQIRLGPFGLYPEGKFSEKRNHVTLISNGFGTTLLPFRLGAPAECHVLTLHRSNQKLN